MLSAHAARPGAWASAQGLIDFLGDTLVIAEADVRKLLHDPLELLVRAVQPALWLLVFGQVFGHIRGVPTGAISYQDFLTPGVLAQSGLFVAIFYGISAIWERDLGVLQKYMASPVSRVALVLGKALSAGVRGLSQGVIVYFLSVLLHVDLRWEIDALVGVLAAILLGSAAFATLSLIVSCLVKTRERMMGIGQVLTMPLFFASSAIYPVALMPGWLRVISGINPLTYQVDALRALMIQGGTSVHGLGMDFAVLAGVLALFVAVGSRLYPSLVA
jgi:ABC-2 type transport system permease protein